MKSRNGLHDVCLCLLFGIAARDVSCLVLAMACESYEVYTNVPDVMPPPVTGTTEEKAVICLERLQLAFEEEDEKSAQDQKCVWIQNGWMSKHWVRGATGIGRDSQKPVLRYMEAKHWIQLENRDGHWWLRMCPAGSGVAPHAPAIDGGDPAGLVPSSAATQQPPSMQQQDQQKQHQQNQPVTTASGVWGATTAAAAVAAAGDEDGHHPVIRCSLL